MPGVVYDSPLEDARFDALFVRRIDVAEEETDGDGIDLIGSDLVEDLVQSGFVEGYQFVPAEVEAFRQFVAAFAGNQRWRNPRMDGVEIGSVLAADEEQVAKAGGCNQSGARAFALEDGVGGDGGAVGDLFKGADPAGCDRLQASQHRAFGLIRAAHQFVNFQLSRVNQHQIGEGTADIHTRAHQVFLSPRVAKVTRPIITPARQSRNRGDATRCLHFAYGSLLSFLRSATNSPTERTYAVGVSRSQA